MIRNTFSLLNGIGDRFERHLWRNGVLTWDDFCNRSEISGINHSKKNHYDAQLIKMSNELKRRNSAFFATSIKKSEHWRLFEEFKEDAVCIDIETNGLHYKYGGYITMVGLYDGFDWKCLIRGENLTLENLNRELNGYKLLITFYGSVFDLPFLYNLFPEIRYDIPHFDLCFAARRLGIKGGMKKIEDIFGISRDESVRGFNGYDAVKLWQYFQKGSLEARELLLTYNMHDTVNLYKLGNILYKMLRTRTGIEDYVRKANI